MSKKKKQIIIIATVLLLCIAVVTTVVLITRNSGRKQEDQTVASGEVRGEEQTDGRNEGEDTSEHATSSSDSTERTTEPTEGSTTEEDQKPAESESMANTSKPTGGTTNNPPQTTTQSTTQASASPTTQAPTTQSPNTTAQPSGGNQGGGNGGNTHQHTWEAQYRTVHHDEEGHYENVCVKEAYDEPIYEGCYICNYCHQTFGRDEMSHFAICGPPLSEDDIRYVPGVVTTAGSSYSTGQVQVGTTHHDAVYEKKWIIDKKAYDEQVSNGYKCTTCGATK